MMKTAKSAFARLRPLTGAKSRSQVTLKNRVPLQYAPWMPSWIIKTILLEPLLLVLGIGALLVLVSSILHIG